MKLPRITIPAVLVLAIALSVLGDGCSQGEPEVDKSAEYTPESLAQELAFRFSGLSPESKKSTRRPLRRSKSDKSVADLERSEKSNKKSQGAPLAKERSGPPTVDDLLDDVGSKLDKIKATPRAESYKNLIEAISKDELPQRLGQEVPRGEAQGAERGAVKSRGISIDGQGAPSSAIKRR